MRRTVVLMAVGVIASVVIATGSRTATSAEAGPVRSGPVRSGQIRSECLVHRETSTWWSRPHLRWQCLGGL
jgi:hypothetical protein